MNKTGAGLSTYATGRKGTPYFYGAKIPEGKLTESKMATMNRMYPSVVTKSYITKARKKGNVGKVNVDCSGLIAGYREKNIGSYQLYSTAYTRLPIANVKQFAFGTVLWKSGHVGVYIGLKNGVPMCVEAKGIDYGTIESKVVDTSWKYGLTFADMSYDYSTNLIANATWKGTNPYKEPIGLLIHGSGGTSVKWLQWELNEAGFNVPFSYNGKSYKAVKIDGDFGDTTEAAVRAFQQSCKIEIDGRVGSDTRKYLKAN